MRLILFLLTAALAQAVSDGQLTVAGQSTKLTQAYAYSTKGFFDEKKDDTVLLLTDRAITDTQLRDGFALRHLAEEGKLTFIQETINSTGQIVNFTVGNRAFKISPSGGSTEHRFEGKLDANTISGKVFTRGLQESFGGTKYEYSASFQAAVQPKK
ncbi:MAG: hypothetical protein ABJF23_12455 [Bryobacteraceae bacterium]